ncbi:MAG: hypothetical protein HQL68_12365 [Magnetococcales bacterium]|nr:hypothetical protein [Magnetococcales bacterium]
MDANYPEHYPEFVDKYITEVMPFLFGAMAVKNLEGFFLSLLEICQSLPQRFHRWYGDQVALFAAFKSTPSNFGPLNPHVQLVITDEVLDVATLNNLQKKGVHMITSKGSGSEEIIKKTYENLVKLHEAK